MESDFENRLDELRHQAKEAGTVEGTRAAVRDAPIPPSPAQVQKKSPGYYGMPMLKEPVWTWQIPTYFFIGGIAGMSAPIAAAALLAGELELARAAIWTAFGGAVLSPALLAWDLGRPSRFLNMLRVFKWQSPMSVGSWILTSFGGGALLTVCLIEWQFRSALAGQETSGVSVAASVVAVLGAVPGVLVATYTGALLAVTAVPVWFSHRLLLPFHFGSASLGSAAALLLLVVGESSPLLAIGILAAAAETAIALRTWLAALPVIDRPLHDGLSGLLVISAEVLSGPVALVLWLANLIDAGAAAFLVGAFLSRWGWLIAGRASSNDPKAVLAAQRVEPG